MPMLKYNATSNMAYLFLQVFNLPPLDFCLVFKVTNSLQILKDKAVRNVFFSQRCRLRQMLFTAPLKMRGAVHSYKYCIAHIQISITGTDIDRPGAPGAAVPSSPGGSGSRTLDSSSASASSTSPLLSAARPSEAHPEVRHTLSPEGRRQASDTADTCFLNPLSSNIFLCFIYLVPVLTYLFMLLFL